MQDRQIAPNGERRKGAGPCRRSARLDWGKRLVLWSASAGLVLAGCAAARAETLADAIALAYQTNPTLTGARVQLRITDETLVQAKAGYRPTATLSGGTTQKDIASNQYSSYQTATLSVSQPVFTGGRVGSRISAAEGDILSGREELRKVESTVLGQVIQAYVDVRRDEQTVSVRRDNVAVLEHQVAEAQARFAGGAITRTDVAQSQAGLAASRVQLAQADGQLAISRANYLALVGQAAGALAPEPSLPSLPQTLDLALTAAEASSPAILGAKYAEQASRARVAEARAERLPSAAFNASVGYEPIDSLIPRSPYIRNFTAGATVSMPLFQGGVLNSRIRQALGRNNADRIAIEAVRRAALQNVAQAWSQLQTAQRAIGESQEEVAAAQIAFEGAQEEQRVGARTTLEVLTAQQNLAAAQLGLINARHDLYVAQAGLLNFIGRLDAQSLAPETPRYDPQQNLDRVAPVRWATPWTLVPEALDQTVSAPIRRPAPAAVTGEVR